MRPNGAKPRRAQSAKAKRTRSTREPVADSSPERPQAHLSGYGLAYVAWFTANVRREIAAGRLRETIENGARFTIH